MAVARIWVDTDIALGSFRGDVDDGLALAVVAAAAQSGVVELLGVSATAGNTDAVSAAHCAAALLQAAHCESVSVVPSEGAAEAIAGLPAGTSLLALGPLTHVAEALRLNPEVARCSLRTVLTVRRPLTSPLLLLSDLNRRADPRAAHFVMRQPWRELRIFPLDVVRKLRIGRTELERIGATGLLGAYLAEHSERWLRRTRWRYPLRRSFPAWDLVAALDAVDSLSGRWDASSRLVSFDPSAAFDKLLAWLEVTGTPPEAESRNGSVGRFGKAS